MAKIKFTPPTPDPAAVKSIAANILRVMKAQRGMSTAELPEPIKPIYQRFVAQGGTPQEFFKMNPELGTPEQYDLPNALTA